MDDLESEFLNQFNGIECHQAVVLLLAFRQCAIGHEVGMAEMGIITLGAVGPSLLLTGCGPQVVGILGNGFAEFTKVVGERNVLEVYRLRSILTDIAKNTYEVVMGLAPCILEEGKRIGRLR